MTAAVRDQRNTTKKKNKHNKKNTHTEKGKKHFPTLMVAQNKEERNKPKKKKHGKRERERINTRSQPRSTYEKAVKNNN